MYDDRAVKLISRGATEIRIGIAGMGKMGGYHLACLRQLVNGEFEDYYKCDAHRPLSKLCICGICDSDTDVLEQYEGVEHFADFDALLKNGRPDLVVIATPTQTHFDLAYRSLGAGVHTLVEKPLVTSLAEIEQLAELSRASCVRLISGHVERYNPVSIKIVSLLSAGAIGAGRYSFERTQRHDNRIADDIIVDKVIHDLDLALYFFGEIAEVEVVDSRRIGSQVQQARLSVHHTNGASGSIFVSWLVENDKKHRQVSLSWDDHNLLGDFVAKTITIDGEKADCYVPGMIRPGNNQIKDELVDFIIYCSELEPVLQRVPPLLSLDEIVASVKIIESVRIKIGDDNSTQ